MYQNWMVGRSFIFILYTSGKQAARVFTCLYRLSPAQYYWILPNLDHG